MFLRTCIHSIVAINLKGSVPLFLVIPEGSFLSGTLVDERHLRQANVETEGFSQIVLDSLSDFYKIKPIFCPPNDISRIFKKVPRHTTILDLDVDYLEEFQAHCYSKAPKI